MDYDEALEDHPGAARQAREIEPIGTLASHPVSVADLDPIDPAVAPLVQAVGRAVLGAAALEKVLLVDIAERQAGREGFSQRLGAELTRLEHQPAGVLLGTLKELGIPPTLTERIRDVVRRRNQLAHHFMEDADVIVALSTGEVDDVVKRVDEIAVDCQALINAIAPGAFAGLEGAFGTSLPNLIRAVGALDLENLDDNALPAQLRQQLIALGKTLLGRRVDVDSNGG